jgi:hypothetical protein
VPLSTRIKEFAHSYDDLHRANLVTNPKSGARNRGVTKPPLRQQITTRIQLTDVVVWKVAQ